MQQQVLVWTLTEVIPDLNSYSIAIGEEDSIAPVAHLEYLTDGDGVLGVEGGVIVDVAGIGFAALVGFDDPNLGADNDDSMIMLFQVDLGLVDGLTVQATVETSSDATTDTLDIHGKLGYDVAAGDITVSPALEVSFSDPDLDADDNEELYAKVSVGISGLIDNVDFTIHWDSNDLNEVDAVSAGGDIMGQLVLDTKVSL